MFTMFFLIFAGKFHLKVSQQFIFIDRTQSDTFKEHIFADLPRICKI